MKRNYRGSPKALEKRGDELKRKDPAQASEFYIAAGDGWVGEAKQLEKTSTGRAREVLDYALREYKLAKKAIGETSEILKKIEEAESRQEFLKGISSRKPIFKDVYAYLSIITLTFALFFISLNLTGYSIGNLTGENFVIIGIVSFILGLVFASIYFRKKETKKKK